MTGLRRLAAVTAARLARAAVRGLIRRGGSALPGLLAATLDRDLLYDLIGSLGGGTVLISGTNGKTTATALIAGIAAASGAPVMSNPSGSNLARGLLSHLLEQVDFRGRPRWPTNALGVLELDEAQLISSLVRINPRVVVLTNLFRDQLDRYGELDALGVEWPRRWPSATHLRCWSPTSMIRCWPTSPNRFRAGWLDLV